MAFRFHFLPFQMRLLLLICVLLLYEASFSTAAPLLGSLPAIMVAGDVGTKLAALGAAKLAAVAAGGLGAVALR